MSSFPETIYGEGEKVKRLYHEKEIKAFVPARKVLDTWGSKYKYHIGVGTVANMLFGSVAAKVLHLAEVPVTLVK